MKKTLHLALLSVPLVLTVCAKNKTPAATSTVVTTAPQAVVEAPATLTGKTVVFDYSNAKERTIISGPPGTGPERVSGWHAVENPCYSVKINGTNKKYNKVNSNTGKLISENFDSIEDEYECVLTFTSPTSGTAVRKWAFSETQREAIGITFTIK